MAQISSYPLLTPQLGDKLLGSNVVDSTGNPVLGNPTCQYNFTDVKTLIDQQYVSQLVSSSAVNSQASAINTPYSIQFGTPTGIVSDNVQLLQGGGSATAGDKIKFNKTGTYQITLTYSIGVTASNANVPYLIFRTLKDNSTQLGPSVVYNEKFTSVNKAISLIIPITIQITEDCYYNFQMMRSSAGGGADDGGLVKNATPLNISGVTEPSIATIQISKLI